MSKGFVRLRDGQLLVIDGSSGIKLQKMDEQGVTLTAFGNTKTSSGLRSNKSQWDGESLACPLSLQEPVPPHSTIDSMMEFVSV